MPVFVERLRPLLVRTERYAAAIGLLVALVLTLTTTAGDAARPIQTDLRIITNKEDAYNLYHAAQRTSWRDVPGWFVGPWNHPGIRYYRPLTSILQFTEYRLFHDDFAAYCRLSWLMHAAVAGLLYIFCLGLLKHSRAAPLLALFAVYKFATPASAQYIGVYAVLAWWPAQNDPLALLFALGSLIMLDRYLARGGRAWLAGAGFALAAGIASKEMAYAAVPTAIALVIYRRGFQWRPIALMTGIAAALFAWRRIVIPNPYAPKMMYTRAGVRALDEVARPLTVVIGAGLWWAAVAAAGIALIFAVGLRRRWPFWALCAAAFAIACAGSMFSGGEPHPLNWLFDDSLSDTLLWLLGALLFLKYRREEAGFVAFAGLAASAVAIMPYVGRHYHYWSSAWLGLCDAIFVACLLRWAAELRRNANWSLPFRRPRATAPAEQAVANS